MYNKAILIGRLVRDPELKYTPTNGKPVVNFTIAVDRPGKTDEADFIRIVAWDKVAENVATYMGKGRLIAVEGRLQIRSYEDREGVKRIAAEVVAKNVVFLDGKQNNTETQPAEDPSNEDPFGKDDVPF